MLERLFGRRKLFLGLICAAFVGHVALYDFVSDDAFITLRYADNLASGHGLVYNPGDRVEGFTSPLWTIGLAACGAAGLDMLLVARIGGVLAGVISLLLAYRLFALLQPGKAAPLAALFAPLVLACNGGFACWAGSGMETTLFVCTILGGTVALLADRPAQAIGWTVACLLTRPESLLVFGLFGLWQLLRLRATGWRRFLAWVLPCLGAVLLLFGCRYWYFGEWLPNTYYAKTGGGLAQLWRGCVYLHEYAADHEGLPLMALPVLYALVVGGGRLRFVAVTASALWGATVGVGGDGLPMYRFALAPLPLLLVLQAHLLADLRRLARKFPAHPLARRAGLATLVLVGLSAFVHASRPVVGPHYPLYHYQKTEEIPRWTAAGHWLRRNAPEGASLAAVPIGAVGYYSGLVVYDMVGLTDKHIARRSMPAMGAGWAGHEKHDGAYILSRRPTFLLLGNIDVTSRPRDRSQRPFIPYASPAMWAREGDLYADDTLYELYVPRSVRIGPDRFFNFYQLKPGAD